MHVYVYPAITKPETPQLRIERTYQDDSGKQPCPFQSFARLFALSAKGFDFQLVVQLRLDLQQRSDDALLCAKVANLVPYSETKYT